MSSALFKISASILTVIVGAHAAAQDTVTPGIRLGKGALDKTLYLRCEGIGEVTDIAFGRVDGDDRERLIVAGTRGYSTLDPQSKEIHRTVAFESTEPPELSDIADKCRILDVDGDGDLEFVKLAAVWLGRTSLHGADGKAIWAHPEIQSDPGEGLAVNGTSIADIDGDGKLDFLMTFNATSEVHRLDCAGKLVWSQQWTSSINDAFVFLDVDHDGHKDALCVDGKALIARNAKGDVIAKTTLPSGGFVNALQLLSNPSDASQASLVVGSYVRSGKLSGQNYFLVGADAKTVGAAIAIDERDQLENCIALRFEGTRDLGSASVRTLKQQAPVAGFKACWLQLRINEKSGKVTYDEIIDAPEKQMVRTDGARFFLGSAEGRAAQLLIAYGSTIWSYKPAP